MTSTDETYDDGPSQGVDPFEETVVRYVRNDASGEDICYLKQTDNLPKFKSVLVSLLKSVDFQLTSNRADRIQKYHELVIKDKNHDKWISYLKNISKWRINSIRFKRGVEEALAEVKLLIAECASDEYLESLIRDHRLSTEESDYDPTDADKQLWSVLET